MSGTLYSMDILRLAAESGHWPPLGPPATRCERRSALCGSVVAVDLTMDATERVHAIGIEAKACALGQAAATLLARHAAGRTADELAQVSQGWQDWLAGAAQELPDWPGIELLAEVRAFPARHAAVVLPFEAAARAAAQAIGDRPGGQDHG